MEKGKPATLQCLYDLEGDLLYQVKWYKGQREFFRYTARQVPPTKEFPINGLKVNQRASNETHLALSDVINDNSGEYSCEVSADAPSFYTHMETASFQVNIQCILYLHL